MKTLFSNIIDRTIPADIVYEDETVIAFKDIAPKASVHLLVVPKKVIPKLSDSLPEDQALLGHLLLVAKQVSVKAGYPDAFQVVINNGADAGQEVFHLHLHVLAGELTQ